MWIDRFALKVLKQQNNSHSKEWTYIYITKAKYMYKRKMNFF
jgi:hypothetical protein